MTQRKPSDKIIKQKLDEVGQKYKSFSDEDYYIRGAVEGFEAGAKWARDYDPWHYIEDEELPHVEQSSESFMRESSELIFIDELEYNIETGNFVVCDRENTSFFDNGSDVWEPSEVKCWMKIPQPQK